MKNIVTLFVLFTGLWLHAIEAETLTVNQTPGYDVPDGTRDPFAKKTASVAPKDEHRQGARQKSVNQGKFVVHGAMKGNSGQTIGVFNFGVLAVGNIKQVMIGGKKVDVKLLSLDMATMDAELKVGKDTIKVSKKGGKK